MRLEKTGEQVKGAPMNRKVVIPEIALALRAAFGSGLSVALAQACKLEYPIYALIAAVLVTDFSSAKTRELGLQRIVATVVGATCGAVLQHILQPSAWAIGVGILVAMLICHFSSMRGGAKVAGYICGIVMLAHGPKPWSYALFRLIETALGIAVAWLISLVPSIVRINETNTPKGASPHLDREGLP